ncbi:MAG: GYF domain-containing protein [Phycisphaerales bacterium]
MNTSGSAQQPRQPVAPGISALPSATDWYYATGAEPTGPVPLHEIETRITSGLIRRRTLVWTAGLTEWIPAERVEAFRPLFPEHPGPAPARDTGGPAPTPVRPPTLPGPVILEREHSIGARMLLPVGRSGYALAAGYLGIFALFPFLGFVAGALAIVFGILAIRDIRRHPQRHGLVRAVVGISLGGLSVIAHVIMAIGLLMR